jgi:hypothetical protein
MTKYLFVLLMLFSTQTYALTEQQCLNIGIWMSQVSYELRDKHVSLAKAKARVLKESVEIGVDPEKVKKQAYPLIEYIYSKQNKNKKTEVLASEWYETCLKGSTDGARLPGSDKTRWQDRADLQRGRDSPAKEAG